MRAVVHYEYGPPEVLRLEEIEKPVPEADQVLIKVHAAGVNPLDWHYMRGVPRVVRMDWGRDKPKDIRLGEDVAGVIEAVGSHVTQFKPGDQVFGTARGSFGEYVRASADKIALKPPGLSFEQAAAVPVSAVTALQALRDKGRIQAGQKVLINGASGGVGTFAVQIAKSFGAQVTGVCSTRNLEMVRSLGAVHVIDYTQENFTRSAERYDVILDMVGNHPLSKIRRVMSRKGVYVLIGAGGPDDSLFGPLGKALKAFTLSPFVSQKLMMLIANVTQADLNTLAQLLAAKQVTAVIDRTYTLSETAEAIRYVELGHARGKVVISVANDD